jgi:hypothetical protein
MIPVALNRPLLADFPAMELPRPSFDGVQAFVSGGTWEWFRPLREGDQPFSFGGTELMIEKRSQFAE